MKNLKFITSLALIKIYFNLNLFINQQAVFASCIPEILDLIGSRPKYGGTFKSERRRLEQALKDS